MDYKAVLEEQIKEMQKVQIETPYNNHNDCNSKINVAEQIRKLVETMNNLKSPNNNERPNW